MSTQAADIVAKAEADADDSILTVRGAFREIAFGSAAGMVAELFEYPFDLAKVRLQAQLLAPGPTDAPRFNGPLHCLVQTWNTEGFRGLYRGLPAPMVGSMAETAAVFMTYTAFQNAIRAYSPPTLSGKPRELSFLETGIASGGAGFLSSFVLTPIELVKCKMQVQLMNLHPTLPPTSSPGRIPHRTTSLLPSSSTAASASGRQLIHNVATLPSSAAIAQLPGPIALVRSIVNVNGFRGLWLGHTGTILRETGGCAAWFMTKEWVARALVQRRLGKDASTKSDIVPWESAFAGAVAGGLGALALYPADTVKSAMQTEEDLRPKGTIVTTRSTFMGTFRKMWVKHGLKGLYAGCGMTVARAVPSSGIIFVVYDGLTAWIP